MKVLFKWSKPLYEGGPTQAFVGVDEVPLKGDNVSLEMSHEHRVYTLYGTVVGRAWVYGPEKRLVEIHISQNHG